MDDAKGQCQPMPASLYLYVTDGDKKDVSPAEMKKRAEAFMLQHAK